MEGASDKLVCEASEFELKIVATRPRTPEGAAGWLRVIERAEFDDAEGVIAAIAQSISKNLEAAC